MENNRIRLAGLVNDISYSHNSHGEDFYTALLTSKRASGTEDVIRLTVPKVFADKMENGKEYEIIGSVRTRNELVGEKTRLIVRVFVNELYEYGGFDYNEVELDCYLCKKPLLRETPLGRKIADLLLAVNRRFGRSDYIPAIAWGRSSEAIGDMPVGTRLLITGRLQSRAYSKKISETEFEERIAYELSIFSFEVPEEYDGSKFEENR